MAGLGIDAAGTTNDNAYSFTFTPAQQLASRTQSTNAYAWTGQVAVNRAYATNGLNQYTAAGAAAFAYDGNGNLTSDGTSTYTYDIENRLVGAPGTTLRYDPLGRLYEVSGANGIRRFLYDGDMLVAEYNAAGTLKQRYLHGSAAGDDPLAWFEGNAVTAASLRHLLSDERGSIVGVSDASGTILAINSYDEYGIPGATNMGRFQYTGQAWLPELGMYHYKARVYSPTLGRFLQTDPIGYEDAPNLYAYVGGDPINAVDPTGTSCTRASAGGEYRCVVDDRRSFTRAGYTGAQINRLERALTREVNRLASNPDAQRTLTIQGSSITVTSGQIAGALSAAHVRFTEGLARDDIASAAGGPQVGRSPAWRREGAEARVARDTASVGRPYILNIHRPAMANGHNAGRTIIHEGIHFLPQNVAFRDLVGFSRGHQDEFDEAAGYFQSLRPR